MESDRNKHKGNQKPKKNRIVRKRSPVSPQKDEQGVSNQAPRSDSEGTIREASPDRRLLLRDDTTASNATLLPKTLVKKHPERKSKRKRMISSERVQKLHEGTGETSPTGRPSSPGSTFTSSSPSSPGTSGEKSSSEAEHEAPLQPQPELKLKHKKEGGVQNEALSGAVTEKTERVPQRPDHGSTDPTFTDASTTASGGAPATAPDAEALARSTIEDGASTPGYRQTGNLTGADTPSLCSGGERWRNTRVLRGARTSGRAPAEATSSSAEGGAFEDGEGFALTLKPRKSGHSPRSEQEMASSESSSSGHSKMRSMGRSWISQIKRDLTGDSTPRKSEILAFLKRQLRRKPTAAIDEDTTYSCLGQAQEGLLPGNDLSWVLEDENEHQTTATTYSQFSTSLPSKSKKMPGLSVDQAPTAEELADIEGDYHVPGAVWTLRSRAPIAIGPSRFAEKPQKGSKGHIGFLTSALAIPLLIFLSLLVVLFSSRRPARPQTALKARLFTQLASACGNSAACRRSVDAIKYAADIAADSCIEFDRFVCGRWKTGNPQRRSYRIEDAENYTRVIDGALQRVHSKAGNEVLNTDNPKVADMAAFYSSCRKFLNASNSTAPVFGLITSMGLDERSRDEATAGYGKQSLLNFIVGNSMKNGLASIISVTSRGKKVVLDAGETLHSVFEDRDVLQFLNATLGQMGGDQRDIEDLYNLDIEISNRRSKLNNSGPFITSRLRDLPPPVSGASWADALNQGYAGRGALFSPESVADSRGVAYISEAMKMLSRMPVRKAHLYVSAVFLAQVMKHVYDFRGRSANGIELEDIAECLKVTGRQFKELLPNWITATFVPVSAVERFRKMVQYVRDAAATTSAVSGNMPANVRDFFKVKISIIGSGNVSIRRQASRAAPRPMSYDERFLLSVVKASRNKLSSDYGDDAAVHQIRGQLVFTERDGHYFAAVPANLLAAEAFVGDDSVPLPNYAALGVRLLLEWLEFTQAAAGEQSAVLASRIDCIRQSASVIFDEKLSDEEARLLLSAQWAVAVALAAADAHRRNTSDAFGFSSLERASHQYFYMWFCHTLCGEEGALARACRYLAVYIRHFGNAFHCHLAPPFDC